MTRSAPVERQAGNTSNDCWHARICLSYTQEHQLLNQFGMSVYLHDRQTIKAYQQTIYLPTSAVTTYMRPAQLNSQQSIRPARPAQMRIEYKPANPDGPKWEPAGVKQKSPASVTFANGTIRYPTARMRKTVANPAVPDRSRGRRPTRSARE